MTYEAPLKDFLFNNAHIASNGADPETAAAVLAEFGRFCAEEIAPLNMAGDRAGSACEGGQVRTAPGFREAYGKFVEMGWPSLCHPEVYGGQGLPPVIGAAAGEILNAANMSFALCPLLTDGAMEALSRFGDEAIRAHLPHLVSGRWTGTMNLTEPQAGSDLSLLRTRAERQEDGSYRITGTKIFITYGEHDLAENILHLVLARTPDAPAGVKGISLFLVPKVLADGRRNRVTCQSVEHKLGVRASPTCVMEYDSAEGILIGAENAGLDQMFAMMNAARFAVGVQGIAIAERAYQQALDYAKGRLQGRPVDGSAKGPVAIINHPDIRRLLGQMRARTEACRSLAAFAAGVEDPVLADYLVPLVKGFCTEMAVLTASDGVQVHGGMGFIEETGAAQHYRDARILPIYEGTTAIQANDLVGRKTLRDRGAMAEKLVAMIAATEAALHGQALADLAPRLAAARADFEVATDTLLKADPLAAHAGAVPYLMLAGNLVAGWQMARAALAAEVAMADDPAFMTAKIASARFYISHILPETALQRTRITEGATSLLDLAF
ncbi:acyl-CoA dehydrogenase [Aliigemmobacter aestuarii]|uniref:3-methylmercaptopropionyl-CoA dehydrogenase n=1 Tax=Aliigemmobacter aestuarii TaxID=1445661 RepID=A0A4S3MV99_9RHOB|nr:acyl-CoA dehydrogenase [Gemmobacter aestuarii]THD85491.1 acyl-CoA dehydrogenase [Gemmobacter aestuarii]